ncbi:39S ribosomal protein L28, mitochondrial-like [Mizuhopecten yessoensis]|uniref:Large ribosomal subunit protein bL28m n=1 Tax=Mizuhopecten yessoensis TaxID=6573 RepID=A0A210QG48_MIZYE|nr:39S ribosomal protein L28, mitochondrial-like [Mizuhopecten yessoensis]XP_021358982.1 39S ribosomal protein L28, mitochondrial-like [Mizuhopecten yessoensis]OWF47720.1 39S ribosomal protein L28, mitochondrial [Mizuhopecten yessoensis]
MAFMLRSVVPRIPKLKKAAYTYTWDKRADKILPDHYKKRCIDFLTKEPEAVHYVPSGSKWRYDVSQHRPVPVQDVPPEVTYPDAIRKGLFGGEGYIRGFTRKSKFKPRVPRVWAPVVKVQYLYSEILDQWLKIHTTNRVMNQITRLMGLDYYILETHERDLNSQLGMTLKRQMLMALAQPEKLYPDQPNKRQFVLKCYGKYTIPLEEAEWIGLPVEVAIEKAKAEMKTEKTKETVPLKDLYRDQYIERLRNPEFVQNQEDAEYQ